jgi:exopolysaccharide biosynthesis protein
LSSIHWRVLVSDYRSDRNNRNPQRGEQDRRPRPMAPSPYRSTMQGPTGPYGGHSNRRVWPMWLVVVIDVLVLGVLLNVYALVIRYDRPQVIGQELPSGTATVPAQPNPSPTLSSTATTKSSNTNAQQTNNTATTTTSVTSTSAAGDQGMWGAKFADKFTSGDVQKTTDSYKSKNVNISIKKYQENNQTYFVADIYIRDLKNLQAVFAHDTFGGSIDSVINQSNDRNAILAMNADNAGNNLRGYTVRDGKLYRSTPYDDVLVMYNDGSMKTFDNASFNFNDIKTNGAWQVWSFGPMLLDGNGQTMTNFNTDVAKANPRSVIGYYEPGHYCFVLVDGRQPDYSDGMTMSQLSQLMYSLGCKVAYNFDGGQSSVMTFNGNIVNKPYNNGRRVSDIVYIGETN